MFEFFFLILGFVLGNIFETPDWMRTLRTDIGRAYVWLRTKLEAWTNG